jgi:hypothetical protein
MPLTSSMVSEFEASDYFSDFGMGARSRAVDYR